MGTAMLSYLSGLEQNNSRDWYHAHKTEAAAASKEFEALIESLILEIGKWDSRILGQNAKGLTFKLIRDTRFSHDKSPYNPTFRCHLSPFGKLPVPVGFFLSVHPGGHSFLGGGLFADMFPDATARIRDAIAREPEKFLAIVNETAFAARYRVMGTALKKVPKGYPADCPAADYLKLKNWYLELPLEDAMLAEPGQCVPYAAKQFLLMKPFNDFLNEALEGFEMPSR